MKIGFIKLLDGMFITGQMRTDDTWTISGHLVDNTETDVEIKFEAHYPERVSHLMRLGGLISVRFDILVNGYKAGYGHIQPDEMEQVANYFIGREEQAERENIQWAYKQIEHLI